MHPSQAVTAQQMQMFMANSGYKQGLTYRTNYFDEYENKQIQNCMMYLYRVGAQLRILCHKDGKLSHIVDSSYVHAGIMETWDKIKKDAKKY